MKDRTYPGRGLHGELVHDIGVRILGGDIKPGDSVVTERDDQDVSRTVVREAVKVLAAKGLIASRPKTGTQVRERRYWHMLDPDVLAWRLEAEPGDDFYMTVFETRRLIEPAVAALAATRASKAEVAELEAAFARMEESVGTDTEQYIEADASISRRFDTRVSGSTDTALTFTTLDRGRVRPSENESSAFAELSIVGAPGIEPRTSRV